MSVVSNTAAGQGRELQLWIKRPMVVKCKTPLTYSELNYNARLSFTAVPLKFGAGVTLHVVLRFKRTSDKD